MQYHHIVEWADDNHFRPEDMMALCPTHHDQASKHAFPEAEQRMYKNKPHNISRGYALGLLAVKQDYAAVNLGNIALVTEGDVLTIDGSTILGISVAGGCLSISMQLNDKNGAELCTIIDNEWISGDPLAWDIDADWQTLAIRERSHKVNMSIDAKKKPTSITGEFWKSGKRFKIEPSGLLVNGAQVRMTLRHLAFVGAPLSIDGDSVSIAIGDDARIVAHADQRTRLWLARNEWRKVQERRANVAHPL